MGGKIKYILKRVRMMSFPELVYRARWKLKLEGYYRFKSGRRRKFGINHLDKGGFCFEKEPKDEIIREYKKRFDVDNVLKNADLYCKNKIPIFDVNEFLGDEIDWNKDYKTGKRWPKKFIGDLHHEDSRYGFVRYVWELNRQSYLFEVAKAYYLSGNEKYAEKVVDDIESWIKQNPYLKTINWFSGLELGVRLINWVWALKLIKDYPGLYGSRLDNIMNSIYLQADFVYNNLSKYSSANNHLIGELAALKIVSSVFPEFKKAKEWKRKSDVMLRKEIKKQILSDGVGAEQTTNYLIFILNLAVNAFALDKELEIELKNRFVKARKFIMTIRDSDFFPNIGDSDDAGLIPCFFENKVESVINSISILSNDKHSDKVDENNFWVFGLQKIKNYEKLKLNKVESNSCLFDTGGYFVSKSKNACLIFDCGALGYLETAGHGHCDALSFILSVDGKEVFVDPGTYVYQSNIKWRNYFRGTSAHNTIKIDNKNQSKIEGNFIYGKKANVKILDYKLDKDQDKIVALHDGYKNVGVIHKREIIHEKLNKRIVIIDSIRTKGKHLASIYFNLHPSIRKIKQQGRTIFFNKDGKEFKLMLDSFLDVIKHEGQVDPLNGWFSPSFGVKVPCVCIEGKVVVEKPRIIKTIIRY